MNRIDIRFAELARRGRCGLIPFITAGDPLPGAMVELMHALVDAGADLIELGVPFSDPMADGPVIQHASERALLHGVGLDHVFDWVRQFRQRDTLTPVVLMGYLNPIEMRGCAAFAAAAVEAGVDGVLLVDCPLEEDDTVAAIRAAGLRMILLAAPTTSGERLEHICRSSEGFLYYVSMAGVTGVGHLDLADVAARVAPIRASSRAPVAVGFGVRDAASALAIAGFSDAVIIGSALVERLAGSTDPAQLCERARDFLVPLRAALDTRVESQDN